MDVIPADSPWVRGKGVWKWGAGIRETGRIMGDFFHGRNRRWLGLVLF